MGAEMSWWFRPCLAASFAWLIPFAANPISAAAPEGMVKIRLGSGYVEGRPLWWSNREVSLLARDGQLVSFRTGEAQDFRQSAPRFFGYSSSDLRGRLYAEFGHGWEITSTRHYLVVTPREIKADWAARFEDLYRRFQHYFRVRGFDVSDPDYPLVAVVFKTQKDYQRYATEQGTKIGANFLGHYSRETNRVYLFDSTSEGADWTQNAETIIHEATHQSAFNTGVHSRFGGTPRWVSEGLATMFEAKGVWSSAAYSKQDERINRGRLADMRLLASRRSIATLESMLSGDRLFDANPQLAYAQAWALSFFLCETRPHDYCRFLARTAAREDFADYSGEQRLADFTASFGENLPLLDAQFVRYIERLPK
ncbi:MAG: DUF1570 domain-containing protein [Planctomycetales bacterium]|nr:DUF1570 domain-containing protein [Planctomycetales bacterium]